MNDQQRDYQRLLDRCDALVIERDEARAALKALMSEANHAEMLKWFNPAHKCHCGSGGHPRVCLRHPLGEALHIAEWNAENNYDNCAEAERDLEKALAEIERLKRYEAAVLAYANTEAMLELRGVGDEDAWQATALAYDALMALVSKGPTP
jgi:hypothetical protein